jgi:hypothetical protein
MHGGEVTEAAAHLLNSFDCAPRNPSKKYGDFKAKERTTYFYCLVPALLSNILPSLYWENFCKLAQGIHLLSHAMSDQQLDTAEELLHDFHDEFMQLYYQKRLDRLHFCRMSMHLVLHLADQVHRQGPLPSRSQWTLERTIGLLRSMVRQPSNPFENLSQQVIKHAQKSAAEASNPMFVTATRNLGLPRGSDDIGGGYVLLRAMKQRQRVEDASVTEGIREGLAPTRFAVRRRERRASLGSIAGGTGFGK